MPHLGDKLKQFRKAKHMNQKQMADLIEVSYRTYQEIEKTGIIKKADVLKKINLKTNLIMQNIAFFEDSNTSEPDIIYEKKKPDKQIENEFLRKRVEDLEKIISLQQDLIETTKKQSPPMETVKNAG